MSNSLQCHQIEINKLTFFNEFMTLSATKVKTRVIGHHVINIIEITQCIDSGNSFILSCNHCDATISNHFGIAFKILFAVKCTFNFFKKFTYQIIKSCIDVTFAVMFPYMEDLSGLSLVPEYSDAGEKPEEAIVLEPMEQE